MQIDLLGPLAVRLSDDARAPSVELAGVRLRGLMIRLAVDAPLPVSASTLIDALWAEEPPADQANALQTLVSRLRRGLGAADTVLQSPAGYRLNVGRVDLDLHRFTELARAGREALRTRRPEEAATTLRAALALWRAPLPEGWGDGTDSAAHQARLVEQRLEVTADLMDAELALGKHLDVVAELDDLVAQFPLRERFIGLSMRALSGAGRQADALARYEQIRHELADDLGIDPSNELQAIHLAVLRGELDIEPSQSPSRSPRRGNLKTAFTSFVGREEEVARIGKLLDEVRLLTLVGPGGAGKTRLATVAVTAVLDRLPDGGWLAELAPVTDPADVPLAVLDALGLRDATLIDRARPTVAAPRDVTTRLVDVLADRTCIIVLDNCEHVVDAAARLADELLARCPLVRIVTTSREPLGILGESLVAVPPLPQPATGASPADALDHPAVRLFADRAAAVDPDFAVDAQTVAAVIEIVRRLDGLPLAIELAAARLRSLPVDEVAARLSDRFRLLTGGSRTALPRHRTLRAVVEWSWDLLTAPERLLAERLAVFAGDISPAEAIAICGDDEVLDGNVDDVLASLVDKSLLQTIDGGRRHRMLETIREYGLERLAERGDVASMRRRHAARFAALVSEAAPHSRRADQLTWIAQLEAERENILAGLRFLCDDGQAEVALELALALGTYWMFTGRNADAATWLSYALRAPGPADSVTRLAAEALCTICSFAMDMNREPDEIEANLVALRQLGHRLDAIEVPDDSLVVLLRPVIAMFADDHERLAALVEAGLTSSDPWIAASVRMFRAAVAENNGDVARMRTDAEIALSEFRAIGERWGIASSLGVLAHLKTMESDLDGAIADVEEALGLTEQLAGHDDTLMLNMRLADLRMRTGDVEGARRSIEQMESIADLSTTSFHGIIVHVVLAEIALNDGELTEARQLCATALDRLGQLPAVHPAQAHVAALGWGLAAKLSVVDGDLDTARRQLVDAYRYAVGTKDMPVLATIGVTSSMLLAATAQDADAAQVLGAAARLRGSADPTQPSIAALTARLQAELGLDAFERAFNAGRELDVSAARDLLDPSRT